MTLEYSICPSDQIQTNEEKKNKEILCICLASGKCTTVTPVKRTNAGNFKVKGHCKLITFFVKTYERIFWAIINFLWSENHRGGGGGMVIIGLTLEWFERGGFKFESRDEKCCLKKTPHL